MQERSDWKHFGGAMPTFHHVSVIIMIINNKNYRKSKVKAKKKLEVNCRHDLQESLPSAFFVDDT